MPDMTSSESSRARAGTRTGQLPEEVHSSPSVSSTFALVLGALVVTGAINLAAIKLLDADSPNRGYSKIHLAWSKLENQDGTPDWLVLGDSGCGNAIVPETLQEWLEGSVTELCTIGNMGLLDDAWLLDAHLERHGAPRGVLIVHVYDVWQRTSPPLGLLAHVPRPLGYWKRFDPALDLDWHQSLDVFMARHLPLVGARESLEKLVNDRLQALVRERETDSRDNRMTDTARVRRDFRQHVEYTASTRFAIAPKNREALDRIVELADQHGFQVYLANSPLWEALAADPGFRKYNSEVAGALAAYAGDKASLHYLDGTSTFALHSMTRTVDHIQPGPAIEYSRDLAERIAALRVEELNRSDGQLRP